MKRATPTLNHFTTYTRSWWVNGFVLLVIFFLVGGCVDETSLAGFKKDPRMQVKFKEFNIPVSTIQADSIYSQNVRSSSIADRWLCGITDNSIDQYFGSAKATIFTKISPGSKISTTDRFNFVLTKATLNLELDYGVYGDTLNGTSTFSLHEISDDNLQSANEYFTNSTANFESEALATVSYNFNYDTLKKHITLNTDAVSTNNVIDTITFDLPIASGFFKNLFDTLLRKGTYVMRKKSDGISDTLLYSSYKTDSVFLKHFRGLAIIPENGNRVLGFKSKSNSKITLYYSYIANGIPVNASYNFYFQDVFDLFEVPSFTNISYDRSQTNISGLSSANKYQVFDALDGYSYCQSGTGIFSVIDISEVLDSLDLYDKLAINSAELIITKDASRIHIKEPKSLAIRVLNEDLRLFQVPFIPYNNSGTATLIPDPIYLNGYNSAQNYSDKTLDLFGDDKTRLALNGDETAFKGYLTTFFTAYVRTSSSSILRANHLALTPSTYLGKALDGVSFPSNGVKLRLYYSVPK